MQREAEGILCTSRLGDVSPGKGDCFPKNPIFGVVFPLPEQPPCSTFCSAPREQRPPPPRAAGAARSPPPPGKSSRKNCPNLLPPPPWLPAPGLGFIQRSPVPVPGPFAPGKGGPVLSAGRLLFFWRRGRKEGRGEDRKEKKPKKP